MHHRRDVGHGTGAFDLSAQPIGVNLLGQNDGVFVEVPERTRRHGTIAGLARGAQSVKA
jgi:hypothetical protein